MYEIKEKEKSRMAHFSTLVDCVEDKVITSPRNRRMGPMERSKDGVQTQRL